MYIYTPKIQGNISSLLGFISVLSRYLSVAETEPPLYQGSATPVVEPRGKWDWGWQTLGLVWPQCIHSEGVYKNHTFQHCFLSFTSVILSFSFSLSCICKYCVFPGVLYVLHTITSSHTKYLQDWVYHAVCHWFIWLCWVISLLKNRILLYFYFFSFIELYLMRLFFVVRILPW